MVSDNLVVVQRKDLAVGSVIYALGGMSYQVTSLSPLRGTIAGEVVDLLEWDIPGRVEYSWRMDAFDAYTREVLNSPHR